VTHPHVPGPAGVRAALEAKRAELDTEMGVLTAPAEEPGGISFGKRVGDGTSIAVERLSQVAAYEGLETLRTEVRRALDKIDEDSYGRCDRCGAAIPAERLEARPWATSCLACAAAA
jgi:DnaK suppressor protein